MKNINNSDFGLIVNIIIFGLIFLDVFVKLYHPQNADNPLPWICSRSWWYCRFSVNFRARRSRGRSHRCNAKGCVRFCARHRLLPATSQTDGPAFRPLHSLLNFGHLFRPPAFPGRDGFPSR